MTAHKCHSAQGSRITSSHLLHHDGIVSLKGDVHIHVVLQRSNAVGRRKTLTATALSAGLQTARASANVNMTCKTKPSASSARPHSPEQVNCEDQIQGMFTSECLTLIKVALGSQLIWQAQDKQLAKGLT